MQLCLVEDDFTPDVGADAAFGTERCAVMGNAVSGFLDFSFHH